MVFHDKAYDRLHNLWRRWGITQEDTYYAIENDLLRTSVWLPLRYVERGVIKDGRFIYERHEPKEGFSGVRPQDFRRICSTGRAKLREFRSIKQEGHIFRLAYEPPQPAIMVRIGDLVVLQEDRKKFEETYSVGQGNTLAFPAKPGVEGEFHFSNDYRHVTLRGKEFHLGDVQARVVEQLHDAARSRQPWVHGKTLIYESGSRAVRVRDIFKHKREWRSLISSDDRGYYRLNLPLQETENDPAKSTIHCKHNKNGHEHDAKDSGNQPIPPRKSAPVKPVVLSIQFILVFVAHQIARAVPLSNAMSAACDLAVIA